MRARMPAPRRFRQRLLARAVPELLLEWWEQFSGEEAGGARLDGVRVVVPAA
jgi:hypothetical protein